MKSGLSKFSPNPLKDILPLNPLSASSSAIVNAPLGVRCRFLLGNTLGSCRGQNTHVLLQSSVVLISTVRIESEVR